MTVRPARPSDLAPAQELWLALHREHQALDPRYRLAEDAGPRWATDFREWTRSRTSAVWLALDGGLPVGLATAHLVQTPPTFEPVVFAHVDDLYVTPGRRGRGIGAGLLDAVRQWAGDGGATEIRAGVLAANPGGRRFWAREGARDLSVTVTMPVRDEG